MIQIVVPMAGAGRRFSEAGFQIPKPLIPVFGKPMISLVIGNLTPRVPHRFFFIVQNSHLSSFRLEKVLRDASQHCDIFPVSAMTEGAACTVNLVKSRLDGSQPLMIANCDQYLFASIDSFVENCLKSPSDGVIMTMRAFDPKWSYVSTARDGLVSRVVEKEMISDEATVGIYYFSKAADYFLASESMIEKKIRVNNEFYVAPVYNEMIAAGKKIATYHIGEVSQGMAGLGTPDDLLMFLRASDVPPDLVPVRSRD